MVRLCSLAVLASLAGACGDNATGGPALAVGIFPAEAFLGRRVRVEITGDSTAWHEGVSVDFGDGIGVGTISVAGPSTLFVDIAVDATTLPGLHDVTITQGDETVTLKSAFFIEPPIVLHFQGNVAQGAMALFTIINHDFDAPFDTTSFAESAFENPVFTNLTILGPVGSTFAPSEVTPYTITGTAMFDVDAAGGGTIQVISGPAGDAITSPLGFGITVTPRAAMPLASFASNTLVLPFDSHLYEMTPATAPHIARFAVRSIETDASPRVAILPASGHFADLLSESSRSTLVATNPTSNKYYAIYFDRRGGSGYVYDLTETSTSLTKTPEAEPNDTAGAAQALALPLLLADADLASQLDQDWVAVEIAASDIGRRLHVITTSNDPRTDTLVDVLGPGMTSLGGPSSDANFHEDFLTTPITAAGTHYVTVSASQTIFFDPDHKDYVAAIFLE